VLFLASERYSTQLSHLKSFGDIDMKTTKGKSVPAKRTRSVETEPKPWHHDRYKSVTPPPRREKETLKATPEEAMSWFTLFWVYVSFTIVIILGHMREFLHCYILRHKVFQPEPGIAPLIFPKEYFFTRWMYGRIRDCWDRPICGVPAGRIELLERDIRSGEPWF